MDFYLVYFPPPSRLLLPHTTTEVKKRDLIKKLARAGGSLFKSGSHGSLRPMKQNRPSRVNIFLRSQNPQVDSPQHTAGNNLLILLLASALLRKVSTGYQLTTVETWRAVKDRFREKVVAREMPVLNAPTYPLIPFNYPVADQRSKRYGGTL